MAGRRYEAIVEDVPYRGIPRDGPVRAYQLEACWLLTRSGGRAEP